MFKNRSFIQGLFISYVGLLIPVFLMGMLLNQGIIMKMKKDTASAVTYQLDNLKTNFENRYRYYRDNSIHLSSSPELLQYKMLYDSINARKGILKIRDTNSYDAVYTDVFIYYGNEKIYSGNGLTRLNVYFENTMRCTEQSFVLSKQILNDTEDSVIYVLQKIGPGYLFFHFPFISYHEGEQNIISVNYCVNVEILQETLESLMGNNPIYLSVVFSNGAKVQFKGNTDDGIIMINEDEYIEFQNSKNIVEVSSNSNNTGVSFNVLYDSSLMYKDINRWQVLNTVLTAGILLLSIIISFILSRKYHLRVKEIKNTVAAAGHAITDIDNVVSSNEFDYIHRMIKRIIDESDNQKFIIKKTRTDFRKQTATLLFQGFIKDQNTIQGMMELCNLEIHENYYSLMGIWVGSMSAKNVYEIIEQEFEGEYIGDTQLDGQKAIVVLLGMPNKDYVKENRTKAARKVSRIIEDNGTDSYMISFSCVYENISLVSYAYLETVTVMEYEQERIGDERIMFFEHFINEQAGAKSFSEEDIILFEQALAEMDVKAAIRHFRQMMKHMKDKKTMKRAGIYIRYCLLQTIILAVKNGDSSGDDRLLCDISKINPVLGHKFEEKVTKIIERLCQKPDVEKTDHIDRIIQYIDRNYTKYNLSLDEISEQVGLTKSYISKLFKAKTNCKYIDYVTEQRMNEAKRMLIETNLTVNEIVKRIGYCDEPTFRKKFKDYFGVNTSELRKAVN
jgi:two-component system response regulator YesN